MRIRFHREAVAEARAARRWYAEREPDVAQAFVAELDAALERIAKMPRAWPAFEAGTHRYLFRRFPYHVIYRETPNAIEAIEVVAVMHGRRRPGYWHGR